MNNEIEVGNNMSVNVSHITDMWYMPENKCINLHLHTILAHSTCTQAQRDVILGVPENDQG